MKNNEIIRIKEKKIRSLISNTISDIKQIQKTLKTYKNTVEKNDFESIKFNLK